VYCVLAEDMQRNYEMHNEATSVHLADSRTCWYEVVVYDGSNPTNMDTIA
jgi:cyclase